MLKLLLLSLVLSFFYGYIYPIGLKNQIVDEEKAPGCERSETDASACLSIEKPAFDQGFERFLRRLFLDEFGYTLVGAEPVSFDEFGYDDVKDRDSDLANYGKYISLLQKMFEGSPNFCLKVFDLKPSFHILQTIIARSPDFQGRSYNFDSCHGYVIALVNRRALRKIVRGTPSIRQFVKKRFQNELDFCEKLENPGKTIRQVVDDDRILGYLLGYSKSNIEYALRKSDVQDHFKKCSLYKRPYVQGDTKATCSFWRNVSPLYRPLKPSRKFTSLEEEWQWLRQVSWDIWTEPNPVPPYFVKLPNYICRHGGDSETSRERFKAAGKKIAELFCEKSLQEAIAELARQP